MGTTDRAGASSDSAVLISRVIVVEAPVWLHRSFPTERERDVESRGDRSAARTGRASEYAATTILMGSASPRSIDHSP